MNLRKNKDIDNIIVLCSEDNIPDNYTYEDRLNNKYMVGIPDSSTNPNSSMGSSLHNHGSDDTHNHTAFFYIKNHKFVTEINNNAYEENGYPTGSFDTQGSHPHNIYTTEDHVINCENVLHSHGDKVNDPPYKTIKHIRYNPSSVPLRSHPFSPNIMTLWSDSLDSLDFELNTDYFNKFIKQTENENSNALIEGGSESHTHDNAGEHTHDVTLPSHTHSLPDTDASNRSHNTEQSGSVYNVAKSNHRHSTSQISVSNSIESVSNSNTESNHNHDSNLNIPAYKTLALFKQSVINLRALEIPKGSIVMWLEDLSNIPDGFILSDGTNNTMNLKDKYIKIIPNSTTDPGASGGSNSDHSEQTVSGHIHSVNSHTHNHIASGTTGQPTTNKNVRSANTSSQTLSTHTHSISSNSSVTLNSSLESSSEHNHNAASFRPESITVAFIKKL